MKTIVLGYDESDPAKHALERAAELAKLFGAKVIVTSVALGLSVSGKVERKAHCDVLIVH